MLRIENMEDDEVFQFLAGTFHQDTFYEDALKELLEETHKEYLQDAMYYFNNDEEWKYISDYSDVFIDEETLYHVKDTWENYFKLKAVIDNSYNFWKDNLQNK